MRGNVKFQISNVKFIILAGIAVIIFTAMYNQRQVPQSIAPSPSPSPVPETLTEDERFILNPPAESSRSALKQHAQMVKNLAKESDSLEINNCQPKPLVLKAKQGSDLEIKNQSQIQHRIIIDSKHYYDIPGGGSKVIKAEFKYGPGDYGYVCEQVGKAKIAGFLHVVP